jgi:CheY-like chemotaxis protein
MRRDRSDSTAPKRASLPRRKRELVLYVEDDDDNWEVAEFRLSESYELLRASTAEQACDILRTRGREIDFVLMDIELRGSDLNGIELTELMRGNKLPRTRSLPTYARDLPTISKPVLYVTAHGKRYTSVTLMLSGADRVVSKPLNFDELQAALTALALNRGNV